jgi:hypothetical protein
VNAKGIPYFSAAGNDGENSWEGTTPSFTTASSSGSTAGEHLLNFDTTGKTNATSLPVTIAPLQPGEFMALIVQWDQPYITGAPNSGGATSQINLCVSGTGGDEVEDYNGNPVSCTGPNAIGSDSYQILALFNPATATANSQPNTSP